MSDYGLPHCRTCRCELEPQFPTDAKCWLLYHGDGLGLAEIAQVLGLVGPRSPAKRIRYLDQKIFGHSDVPAEACEYVPEKVRFERRYGIPWPKLAMPSPDDHSERAETIRRYGYDLDDP